MKRVLVVEDHPEIRSLLMQLLREAGYEVVDAWTFVEAKAKLAEARFDLLVADVLIPGGGRGTDLAAAFARLGPLAIESDVRAAALAGLAVLNAWLMNIVLGIDEVGVYEPVASVAPSRDLSKNASEVSIVKPAGTYAETLAHPVFYKTRAPYVPPPPPLAAAPSVGPPASADPGIALGGVAIRGDLKKAYLFSKGGPPGSWVAEGETFMGWNVQAIHTTGATIRRADRTIALELYAKH